ncbi:hypothetical protein ACQPZJ_01635 [Actinoplanes sp. CA-054009]
MRSRTPWIVLAAAVAASTLVIALVRDDADERCTAAGGHLVAQHDPAAQLVAVDAHGPVPIGPPIRKTCLNTEGEPLSAR